MARREYTCSRGGRVGLEGLSVEQEVSFRAFTFLDMTLEDPLALTQGEVVE